MWRSGLLKKVGALLDAADDKATSSDLQTLTREVAEAAQAATKAATDGAADNIKGLDLGLVDGWNELTSQISGDLKGVGAKIMGQDAASAGKPAGAAESPGAPPAKERLEAAAVPAAPAGVAESAAVTSRESPPRRGSQRLLDLEEHVCELRAREEEGLQAHERLQRRYEEVEVELKRLEEEEPPSGEEDEEGSDSEIEEAGEGAAAEATVSPEAAAKMEAMRREFCQRQAAADARAAELRAQLREAAGDSEPLAVELDFWREKVQRMLAARGLSELPAAVRRRAQRGDDGSDAGSSSEDSAEEAGGAANAKAQRELAELQAEYDRAVQARDDEQGHYELLEAQLADVMRRSDAEVEAADAERRQERELETQLAAAEAAAAAEVADVEAAERRVAEAQQELDEAERELAAEVQMDHEARAASAAAAAAAAAAEGAGEEAELRQELEAVTGMLEAQRRENKELDARLRKCRAAAAADLERAVPLAAPSCWRNIDEPSLKVVTLLVRSSCLRRAFAVHLLGTYVWLFFMIFWLEKH